MDFRSLYRLNLLFINAGGKVKYQRYRYLGREPFFQDG